MAWAKAAGIILSWSIRQCPQARRTEHQASGQISCHALRIVRVRAFLCEVEGNGFPIASAADGRLVPVSEDLFGLFYLFFRAGEVKFHFPGSARDVNLDGGQTTALHS